MILKEESVLDLNCQSFCENVFSSTFFFNHSVCFPYVDLVSYPRDNIFLVLSNFAKFFMGFKYLL